MKKLITMALVASMVLTMAACGNKTEAPASSEASANKGITVHPYGSGVGNETKESESKAESKEESKPVEDVATDTHDTLAAQAAFEGELLSAMGLEKQDGYGWYYGVIAGDLDSNRTIMTELTPDLVASEQYKAGDIVKFTFECNENGDTVEGIMYIVCVCSTHDLYRFDMVYYIPTEFEGKMKEAILFHESKRAFASGKYQGNAQFEKIGHLDGVYSDDGIALEFSGKPYYFNGYTVQDELPESINVVTKPVYTQNKNMIVDSVAVY